MIKTSCRKRLAVMILMLLCSQMLFSGAACAAAEAEDPVVVRVGEVTYPLSVARFSAEGYVTLATAGGEELTEEERQEIVDAVISHLVDLAVIENKLKEQGVNDFTEAEMEILRAAAASQYETVWQELWRQASAADANATEEEITAWMAEKGYTQDAFLREQMASEREGRILDLYCSDVRVTEEEARQYYRETYLEPDKERYADNVPLYEQQVLAGGQEAFYTPEGYRYIKNILLDFPEEIKTALDAIRLDGKKATEKVQNAYNALAEAAASGEDITPLKEAYDEKIAALREVEERFLGKAREAVPLLQETIDSIRQQLADGISIETLLKEYSLDQQQTGADKPGALYHPDSGYWPDAAKAVLNTLKTPGELSEPYADDQGVHLFWYAGNAPGGERVLTAEEETQLQAAALYAAQTEKLAGLIEEWKQQYEIVTDASMILTD